MIFRFSRGISSKNIVIDLGYLILLLYVYFISTRLGVCGTNDISITDDRNHYYRVERMYGILGTYEEVKINKCCRINDECHLYEYIMSFKPITIFHYNKIITLSPFYDIKRSSYDFFERVISNERVERVL
jgi:hypothetical protein